MDSHTFNILSICAGYGGLELALKLAVPRSRTVCAVEVEAYAAALLVQRMQEGALDDCPLWSDARTFDGRPWRGVVHCVAAGYPCQPFSTAGRMLGAADPRHLWPHVARIIREVEPPFVFLENVANHIRLGFGEVRDELRGMGYAVEAGLFTAAEVGAPHVRKRLFALAHRPPRRGGNVDDPYQHGGEARLPGPVAREERNPGVIDYPGLEAFPPGPDDAAEWQRVLGREPTLEPAICRMADGRTSRVDELRALGNGVVPVVAAYAFRTLAAAIDA